MRERTENHMSARIAGLARVEPDEQVRERVLAAMAAAARFKQTGSTRPANTPPHASAGQTGFAIAAGVAAVAILTSLFVLGSMPAGRVPGQGAASELASASVADPLADADSPFAAPAIPAGELPAESLVSLIEVSWLLERALDELPAQRRLMRAGTASTIAALENRIALIDQQLNLEPAVETEPQMQATLWRDRVDAMNALYQVRYGQSQIFAY